MQELAKQNPQLLQLINTHQMEFLRLLNEPSGGTGGTPDAADLAAQLGAAAQGVHMTAARLTVVIASQFSDRVTEVLCNQPLDGTHTPL